MENLRVPELKALAKERGLRGYSKLRKAELIALLTPPVPAPHTRPLTPNRPPPPQPSIPDRPDRPGQLELLEERHSNPLTARQIKWRRNKIHKLNKQIKSSERELESLRSERDSIMDKIEGARKLGPLRDKRVRHMNRELTKIDEAIKESEKVLETVISKLEPAPPSTK